MKSEFKACFADFGLTFAIQGLFWRFQHYVADLGPSHQKMPIEKMFCHFRRAKTI
jgi:hypothetical protein